MASIGIRTGSELDKRLYSIWRKMHYRCESEKHSKYHRYGGRGIQVCEEWNSFVLFSLWAIKNGYSDTLSIERINNDGNYEPSNCKWATPVEQASNRSTGRHVDFNGEIKSYSLRKRNLKWEYRIELMRVNGKRKQVTKGGFNTEAEATYAAEQYIIKHFLVDKIPL